MASSLPAQSDQERKLTVLPLKGFWNCSHLAWTFMAQSVKNCIVWYQVWYAYIFGEKWKEFIRNRKQGSSPVSPTQDARICTRNFTGSDLTSPIEWLGLYPDKGTNLPFLWVDHICLFQPWLVKAVRDLGPTLVYDPLDWEGNRKERRVNMRLKSSVFSQREFLGKMRCPTGHSLFSLSKSKTHLFNYFP